MSETAEGMAGIMELDAGDTARQVTGITPTSTDDRRMRNTLVAKGLGLASLCLVIATWVHAGEADPKRFPPYPDVWEWVAPQPERIDDVSFRLLPLDSGDVLVVYTEAVPLGETSNGTDVVPGSADDKIGAVTAKVSGKSKKAKTRDVVHQVTLFGGQRVVGVASNVRLLRRQDSVLTLEDGSRVRILTESSSRTGLQTLSGGEMLSLPVNYPTYGMNVSYATDCYNGPGRHSLVVRVKSDNKYVDTKAVAAITVFKILDKPTKIRLKGCPYEEDQTFTTRVTNPPVSVAHVLPDGTFFAEIDKGVLMRFDSRLNTRSRLAYTKYFPLKGWNVNLGQSYLMELTGKNYAFPGTYDHYDFQRMVDDLYQVLLELKAKATKSEPNGPESFDSRNT